MPVRVFSKNTDFDIFVRYDSGNLSDYRHFSRFWSILSWWRLDVHNGDAAATLRGSGYMEVSVGTRACQWAQRSVSGHMEVSVGTWRCQWAQGRVSGHMDLSVDTRTC